MTHFLHTDADLLAGLAQLILADPRLAPVAEKAGAFSLRRREAGYAGLCAIVCGQQLSTASAAAIRARLFAAFDPFHHDTVRAARADKLKRLGLSAAKIKSIKEIGKAVAQFISAATCHLFDAQGLAVERGQRHPLADLRRTTGRKAS